MKETKNYGLSYPEMGDYRRNLPGQLEQAMTAIDTQMKADADALTAHTGNKKNPHGVTAAQVRALPITGGTLGGPLYMEMNEIAFGRDAASTINADSSAMYLYSDHEVCIESADILSFGTAGDVSFEGVEGHIVLSGASQIKNLQTPTEDADAATKAYVDASVRSKADAATVEQAVRWHSNPNLLDNWFFGNPVNQRGQTSYSGEWVQTIDRWQISTGTLTVGDDVSPSGGYMFQPLESSLLGDLQGKQVAISVLHGSNELSTATATVPETWGSWDDIASASGIALVGTNDGSALWLVLRDITNIKAVKLELGDTQTLAHKENGSWVLNEIPNYWEQLMRCNQYFPAGIIAMWSGAANAIPGGWLLCDGTNGTPDLRGRFIVGAGGSYAVGDTGGAESVALSIAEMPAHSHNVKLQSTSVDSGSRSALTTGSYGSSVSTDSVGGGSAHENRPPYYALCYIMKA